MNRARHALAAALIRCVVAVLAPCAASCTSSPSPLPPTHDEARAHELTLEALDVIDSDQPKAEELLHAALTANP